MEKKEMRRRNPKQRRARLTVDAVLDAVIRILKREGIAAVTTNHIAEVAGVSIGSVYQYFPNKGAIFSALHTRHVEQIDRVVQNTMMEHARSPLDTLLRAMVEAMIDAHRGDPELHDLLMHEVPHRGDGTMDFAVRLHGVFLLSIQARARELKRHRDPEKMAFVVTLMLESLSHGALFRRPKGLSLPEATDEIARAVLAYVHA